MLVFAFILATLVASASGDFLLSIEVASCQKCCGIIEDSVEFDVPFDFKSCFNDGCNRIPGSEKECAALFLLGADDPKRNGCEIGRDFRFTGVTALLGANKEELFQCDQTTGKVVIQPITLKLPEQADLIRTGADCASCCDGINLNADNGGNDPNDFNLLTCRSTCNTPAFCFDDDQHNDRAGCLVGLDFLTQGVATLDHNLQTFVCNVNGVFDFIKATSFPTAAPTVAPTAAPEGREAALFGFGVVGLIMGAFALFASLYLFEKLSSERRKLCEIQLLSSVDVTPVRSLTSSQGDMYQINIPAAEVSKDSFNLNQFLHTSSPTLSRMLVRQNTEALQKLRNGELVYASNARDPSSTKMQEEETPSEQKIPGTPRYNYRTTITTAGASSVVGVNDTETASSVAEVNDNETVSSVVAVVDTRTGRNIKDINTISL